MTALDQLRRLAKALAKEGYANTSRVILLAAAEFEQRDVKVERLIAAGNGMKRHIRTKRDPFPGSVEHTWDEAVADLRKEEE